MAGNVWECAVDPFRNVGRVAEHACCVPAEVEDRKDGVDDHDGIPRNVIKGGAYPLRTEPLLAVPAGR